MLLALLCCMACIDIRIRVFLPVRNLTVISFYYEPCHIDGDDLPTYPTLLLLGLGVFAADITGFLIQVYGFSLSLHV